MSDVSLNNPTPQFGTMEYSGKPGNDHCQFCHQPIGANYYRVNAAMSCASCADKVRGELAKDTHSAFVRAITYGVGAAIGGLILYATFEIATGLIIGYASLAVGWMVGKAIMTGSGGIGGRRYQIAAALLTYAAVSMAAIPVWIHYAGEHPHNARQQQRPQTDQQQSQTGEQQSATESDESAAPKERMSLGKWLGWVTLLGLASPFVELWEGGPSFGWAIGAFILFIGIKIAWRMTAGRPLAIDGPFTNAPKAG
jgi:hypothetical protein